MPSSSPSSTRRRPGYWLEAEYFGLAAMIVVLPECYAVTHGARVVGVTADAVAAPFEHLPFSLLSAERRRRPYLNALLARAEIGSAYLPSRKLWLRERRGEYVPNPALAVREVDERGEESWRPILEHLGVELRERHVAVPARSAVG